MLSAVKPINNFEYKYNTSNVRHKLMINYNDITTRLKKDANDTKEEAIEIWKYLHQNPEESTKEYNTSTFIENKLKELGITTKRIDNSIIGIIDTNKPGKTIAIRTDIDAIPIKEMTDLPFKSNKEISHACGHDAHTAILLNTAKLLIKNKDLMQGKILLIFESGKEERIGAKKILDSGVLDDVDHIIGYHVTTQLPSGILGIRYNAILSASIIFKIKIYGIGGHISASHITIDPIFILSQILTILYSIPKFIEQKEIFNLSITSIHSEGGNDTIPEEATLQGTISSFTIKTMEKIEEFIKKIVNNVCSIYSAKCEITFEKELPLGINHEETTSKVSRILSNAFPVVEANLSLLSDDFSLYLQKIPGTYIFLGTKNTHKNAIYPLHNSRFKIDEDVIPIGSASIGLLAIALAKNEKEEEN
ncbi:amidohydrolase [Acidianus sulfidivorans JP7]|uniref:Carboxypeptidase n=1 Tax=Acidianus sulfidivorans JP7 TaxID=619593 RepID=A0A2U9ILQ6_9CREN|nr:amidohydrolase [Acidianus sulfidivorans]AWR96988.1 amidohydrolase [Acidianus sulfidivorans JP7]